MTPQISIVVPYHDMQNAAFFLKRCIDSVVSQTFKDYEMVLVKEGLMAENTNAGIKRARGEIVKILFMDDYLAHPFALQLLAENFKGGWVATGCLHDDGKTVGSPHVPSWNQRIAEGINTIGSPSVVAFENKNPLLFDEELSWMLDVDLYVRLFKRYGPPTLLTDMNVVIGVGSHQTTHLMPDEKKQKEVEYVKQKYEKNGRS